MTFRVQESQVQNKSGYTWCADCRKTRFWSGDYWRDGERIVSIGIDPDDFEQMREDGRV